MAFRLLVVLTLLILSFITPPTTQISPPISILTPIDYDLTLTPDCHPILTPDYDLAPAILPRDPSEPPPFFYQDELSRMLVTILNRNDFTIWCTFLTETFVASTLPRNATFFVPVNSAVLDLRRKFDVASFYIRQHTVPHRLSFVDLLNLRTSDTLPTLMPSKELVVTSDSRDSPYNYTINGVLVTHRNIYMSSVFAVHGIRHVFEF